MLTKVFNSPPDVKNVLGWTPLLLACAGGHLDILAFLTTEFECDVSARLKMSEDTALHCACRYGNLEVVRYLVSMRKVDVKAENAFGNTPLHVCTNLDTLCYLLNTFDLDVSSKGRQGMTPLHQACKHGQTDIVKYLIEEKCCDPQCCQDDGLTPLHIACNHRQVEVVEYLLSTRKVDPITKSSGRLPLELAHGSYEIVCLLRLKHVGFPFL